MVTRRVRTLGICAGAAVVLSAGLTGCGGDLPGAPDPLDSGSVEAAVSQGAGIDTAYFAGDFAMKAPVDVPVDRGTLPLVLYAGLSPEGDTRLKMNSFVDLRRVQEQLPEMLSGVLVDTCKHEFDLDFTAAEAEADALRAWGTVDAQFFRCNGDEENRDDRGRRRLAPSINAFAEASANIVGQCIEVQLTDIQLDPQGFLGGLSNALGLTAVARTVILKKANEFLTENTICPELPEELAMLAPRFDSGGLREVSTGGMGAALSGSVDVSASTLVGLVALMKERGVLEDRK